MLEIKNISKRFGKRQIIRDVSLQLKKGEIVGLLGPNGAGKTTTFNITMGFLLPDNGQIYLNNKEISQLPVFQRAKLGMAYLFQEPAIFHRLTVIENLVIILENFVDNREKQRETAIELLKKMGIEHLSDNIAGTLSGGEKRRLEIARSLINNPDFILLDEPFAGVDPIAVEDIQSIISDLKNKGYGILITDHSVRETLRITDRAYIMAEGKILITGTAEELANNPEARKIYLGRNFKLD